MLTVHNTEVRLLSGVPLSNNYEHQMTFNNSGEQASYFLGKSAFTILEGTYQKEESTLKVQKNYEELYSCNYLMYKNQNKWFYAFITKKEYVNPNTTRIYFDIDVWQTYQFDINFLPSFVEREHCKRWNADGSPVINTLTENLEVGAEYETVYVENFIPFGSYKWLVIVSKTPFHDGSTNVPTPTTIGTPQPLSYYLVPFKDNDTVGNVIDTNGMGVLMSKPTEVLEHIYSDTQAVNNVVSMYITEHIGLPVTFDGFNTFTFHSPSEVVGVQVSDPTATNYFNCLYVIKAVDFSTLTVSFSDKYEGYEPVTESKLLMYPYTTVVIDDFKGNRIELKNELIDGQALSLEMRGSLGTSNKVSTHVSNYLGNTINSITGLENGIINNNPNDVPIVTDMLSAYLQGNKNSLENQKAQIMFGGVNSAMTGALTGAVSGAMLGLPGIIGGAVVGGAMSGMNTYFQIQGLNAKQQDLRNTPPQLVSMGGNTAYDLGNDINGIFIIKKQIRAEYRKKLTDYFKMFGYKVNELKTPNLKSRQHFNFIKTIGANITGNVPHDDLEMLRNMFNKGVTLWHTQDICDYSLSNGEV